MVAAVVSRAAKDDSSYVVVWTNDKDVGDRRIGLAHRSDMDNSLVSISYSLPNGSGTWHNCIWGRTGNSFHVIIIDSSSIKPEDATDEYLKSLYDTYDVKTGKKRVFEWNVGDVFEYTWSECRRVGLVISPMEVITPAGRCTLRNYQDLSCKAKFLFNVALDGVTDVSRMKNRARNEYKGNAQMF